MRKRKSKKEMNYTTNSRVYKMALWANIGGCPICPPNRGCNRNRNYDNNWKKHRKNQWRE